MAALQSGDTVTVRNDQVNLRQSPALSAPVVAVLPAGAAGNAAGQSEAGFVAATFDAGSGWVFAAFLAGPGGSPALPIARVTEPGLRLRSAPNLASDVLLTMSQDDLVVVLGEPSEDFLPVSYFGTAGWTSSDYLRLGTDADPWATTSTTGTTKTIEGVDYSRTAYSNSPSVASLNARGKHFAGRYAVNDTSPSGRGITAAEYQRFAAAGIDVFLFWEGVEHWMLDGWDAGVFAAKNANDNIAKAGMPPQTPVYFAHDIDPQPQHFGQIDDCLAGAASVVGAERVGIYGGWLLMDHCFQARNARWLCQTIAWEYHHGLHPAAHLYQYGYNEWIDGTNCDLVRAMQENYGQAPRAGNQPHVAAEHRHPYAASVLPDWWQASLKEERPADRTTNGISHHVARRIYVAKALTARRSEPKPGAKESGPKVDANEKLFGERIVHVKGQPGYWVLTADGHFVLGSKLRPKIEVESS